MARNEHFNLMVLIKFLNLLLYSSKKNNLKNVLVLTKLYWSWAGGLVLIMRIEAHRKVVMTVHKTTIDVNVTRKEFLYLHLKYREFDCHPNGLMTSLP